MKKSFFILLFAIAGSAQISFSQHIIRSAHKIELMVKEISADSLKSYIRKMVGFETRSTLSTLKDKKKGIGAAREWVVNRFNEFAMNSGGRMTVFLDTTIIPADGKRVDVATHLGNAMAILKGTDSTDNRIYLISGHLDSRVTDVMNRKDQAPGANDDGSGVAAVIECARIMSKHSFPATIIFVTVSGEEQGLLGANYMAAKAKREGWNIEAVLNNDIMGSNNSSETNIIDNTRIRVFSEGLSVLDTGRIATNIRNLGLENDGRARQLER